MDFKRETMLDDSRLRVFLAVCHYRNFTVAASRLSLSQAAVSQCIKDLEQRTGAVLFKRGRAGVEITPEGGTFKLFAERILSDYQTLDTVFSDYERYSKLAESLAALSEDPLFPVFKEILSH